MNTWFYREQNEIKYLQEISDFPKGCQGFVYIITNMDNNKFYIGRKILQNTTSTKLSKKAISEIKGTGRRPTKKVVIKESNWKDYFGSCKPLLEDVNTQGKDKFMREILCYCYNKKQMTYYELKYQIIYKVLEKPEHSYNENILGKFFSKDLVV